MRVGRFLHPTYIMMVPALRMASKKARKTSAVVAEAVVWFGH